MRTWQKITVAMLAVAALTGCGKNPAAPGEGERTIKKTSGLSRSASTAQPAKPAPAAPTKGAAPKKAPGVSTKPGSAPAAPANPTTPGNQAGPKTPAAGEGVLRLTIRTWGEDPIGSLVLNVFSQKDPAQTAEVPLQLTGPEAQWEQGDVPAGRYTLRVKALSTKGVVMGVATTEAIVEAGAMTDMTIDLTVDSPVASPTPDSGAAGEDEEPTTGATPTPAPSATPAPTGPGSGGTLGLRVEII